MKKFMGLFLCLFLAVSVAGCFSNPLDRLKRAQDKVEAAQTKKEKTEDKTWDKSIGYNFGAKYALEKVEDPPKQVTIAKSLLDNSLTITGPPSFRDSLEFKQIIDGLMDTNMVRIRAAEVKLAAKNNEVIQLQGQIEGLGRDLEKANSKYSAISLENAGLASKWAKLTKWFWIVVWTIGIGFVIHLLSFVIPPPFNSIFFCISALLGGIVKLITSLAPKAKEFGGVVSSKVHDLSEETLKDLVKSIAEIRKDKELAAKIDPILLDKTNADDSRLKIRAIKDSLGL